MLETTYSGFTDLPPRLLILAVYGLLPSAYRLPPLVLDCTGMRVSELE